MTEEDLHRKISEDVHTTLETKLAELRELQALAEERARQEAHAAEERARREAAERKKAQEEKLDQLIQLQISEAEERQKRQALWNRLLATLVAILTAAAGGGIYVGTRAPSDEEQRERARPVIEKVEEKTAKAADKVEARVEKAEKKIQVLGELAVEQQIQISDGFDYIGAKIDAAHPRTADDVKEPETLQKARSKTDKLKRDSAAKRLFDERDDPFEALSE